MVSEIRITNNVTSAKIVLAEVTGNYILESVDWGTPQIETQSYSVPFQIGETWLGTGIGVREVVITGHVIADLEYVQITGMKESEYYEELRHDIEEAKGNLNKVINVFQEITLCTCGYCIDGFPISPVKYSNAENENNDILCRFEILVKCYRPMFYRDPKQYRFYDVEKRLVFPLILVENESLFGIINTQKTLKVYNEGDTEAGAEIILKAITVVHNPVIYKVNTNESITLQGITMAQGDTLRIITEKGEENAVLHTVSDSEDRNMIGYVTNDSTWFQFSQGETIVSYRASEGGVIDADVTVRILEKYFNIKEM